MMYAVIFLLATSVSLIVAWFAWQRRATPGGRGGARRGGGGPGG
jgi:hypothetical protein